MTFSYVVEFYNSSEYYHTNAKASLKISDIVIWLKIRMTLRTFMKLMLLQNCY